MRRNGLAYLKLDGWAAMASSDCSVSALLDAVVKAKSVLTHKKNCISPVTGSIEGSRLLLSRTYSPLQKYDDREVQATLCDLN